MSLIFSSPPISTTTAHLLTFLFSVTYVGSLYVSRHARLSFSKLRGNNTNADPNEKLKNERWRDDPDVIKARMTAGSAATILNCCLVFYVIWSVAGNRPDRFWAVLDATIARLGFKIYRLDLGGILPYLVTPVLFTGPLFGMYLGRELPFQERFSFKVDVKTKFTSWVGMRNYIMAPITEEVVFRSCVIAVYHMSGASAYRMIFLGPLSFGLGTPVPLTRSSFTLTLLPAHLHHAWDTFNRYGRTISAAKRTLITSMVQLSYTTVFGFLCSWIFLRSGSIYPAISAHVFCNIMGLPAIQWELRAYPTHRKEIISAYVIGMIGFCLVLGPWTGPSGMYKFWSARPHGVNMSY